MTEPVEVKADDQSVVAENQRLRHALYVMVAERNKAATKLTGVQNLGQQLQKKEQENALLKEKLQRVEGTLARAENRITQLSLKLGNGPHQAFSRSGIVTPGVAKKVLEALTRDNTRLKLALDHMTNKGSIGSDIAVENRELHEIIMSLREDRDQKLHEVDELKKALGAVQHENMDALKNQVLRLTTNVTKLERNLNAKQVFCESVVTENERLKEMMDMVKNEKITEVSSLKRALGELTRTQSDIKDIMTGVDSGDDGADGKIEESQSSEQVNCLQTRVDSLLQECEQYKRTIEELQLKVEEVPKLNEELGTRKAELRRLQMHVEAMQENENEYRKHLEELQALKTELHESKTRVEMKETELNDLQIMNNLMQESLGNYEHDFNIERQEKIKAEDGREQALRERDQIVQRYEQLKREHITLRQNIERMYSQATKLQQPQVQPPRRQMSGGRQTCAAQVQEPWQQQTAMLARGFGLEAFADGPADITDAPVTPPKETPTPAPRRYTSQGSQLQCPYCRKNFPHDLLENHMRDCTGDD